MLNILSVGLEWQTQLYKAFQAYIYSDPYARAAFPRKNSQSPSQTLASLGGS